MSTIEIIDDKNFNEVDTVKTPYNLDQLAGDIDTLNQRIAQIVSNFQDQTSAAVQPVLDQIASRKALIDEATAAGLRPTMPNQSLDVSGILDAVNALKSQTTNIASPPVIDTPPIEEPPIEPPVE